ncbi:MAG: acetate--CoA ligase family protein, partial [Actinomycetota bacterium]|nr:acetate--CoA ligase family protein [Actinomycetota bacterium]
MEEPRSGPGAGQGEATPDLRSLFRPRSIAIVGVSQDFTTISGKPMRNLLAHGYGGEIYPVNPRYEEVGGRTCYPSLLEVPGEVDLALVAVSQRRTLDVLRDCAAKGVSHAFLFGAGFAETSEEGRLLQEEALRVAREAGIRLLGPNCIGCLNAREAIPMGFSTSFEAEAFLPGPVALVSQSGALGYAVFAVAQEEKLGFSYVANTGNQVDLDTLDFASFMLEDEPTRLVMCYLESVPNGERLVRLARRAHELGKPLIVLKAGRSELGKKAALSHTASLTGSDRVFRAVAQQHGIVQVDDVDDTLDAMKVFARQKAALGRRVAVVTTSGATGIMMADQCEEQGLEMTTLREPTQERLRGIIPDYGSAMNPVDVTAQALNDRRIFRDTLRVLVEADETDIVVFTTTFGRDLLKIMCAEIAEIDAETDKPVVVVLTGAQDVIGGGREVLKEAGVPVYQTPKSATVAVARLVRFNEFRTPSPVTPAIGEDAPVPAEDTRGVWTEERGKRELARIGVPVPKGEVVESREEAERSAGGFRYPVVAKVVSPDILHKTDAGAVRVGIGGPDGLVRAYDEITRSALEHVPGAEIRGVLVEEMIEGAGVEMFVGVEDDPQFGPVVLCGLGGV